MLMLASYPHAALAADCFAFILLHTAAFAPWELTWGRRPSRCNTLNDAQLA